MPTISPISYGYATTPIGTVLLRSRDDALVGLHLDRHVRTPRVRDDWVRDDTRLDDVRQQLDEYFAGRRTVFDLLVRPDGTPFQRAVWSAVRAIPFGETASYGDIARRVGRPSAARAVGAANGRNPVSIVIPCHRLIGADGSLTGYGWGIERKEWLLAHETAP